MSRYKKLVENGFVIGGGNSWIVQMTSVATTTTTQDEATNKTSVKLGTTDLKIVNWGVDNKLPFQIKEDVGKSTVLAAGLRQKVKVHYGRGPVALEESVNEQGKRELRPTEDKAIKEFFKINRIKKFMLSQITDYEWFSIAFPEYILDNAGSNILVVTHKTAPFLRPTELEKLKIGDYETYMTKYVVFFKKWLDKTPDETTAVPIHFIDPSLSVDDVKLYLKANQITKFIRPTMAYMPATDYFPIPYWNSARESGWVGLSGLIPKVKEAIINSSMTLKYIVRIPLNYFKLKYPEDKFSAAQREALIEEDLTALDDFLKDFKNTGKNLVTYYDIDKISKSKTGDWEIEVIDNKIQDGALNLDSAAANSEMLFALGVDPTIIGTGMPGKEMGAKSGSDKRESYNIAISNAMSDRAETLDCLEFIQEFNGWKENIIFAYEDNILTTLDANPTGMQKQSV